MPSTKKFGSYLFDSLLALSIVGLYPRFVEPARLSITRQTVRLKSKKLKGLKIIQLSDLHFNDLTCDFFLKKISDRVMREAPDLVVFTGDFLCYSRLEDRERLVSFLRTLKGRLGSFCILGNHDYGAYLSRNHAGDYDLATMPSTFGACVNAAKRLIAKPKPTLAKISERAAQTPDHTEFLNLLGQTPFQLIENESLFLPVGLNIVGLGDLAAGRFHPEIAFRGYREEFAGLVLTHNPDTFATLLSYPGDILLAGHSHGEQIHLPFSKGLRLLSKRLTRLEDFRFTRGKVEIDNKWFYTNRGLSSYKPFRFLSPPEMLILSLLG